MFKDALSDMFSSTFTEPFAPESLDFIPSDLSGLSLWFDAADSSTVTLSGSNVSNWDDKSGNGNHVTQGTAGNQPTLVNNVQNGLPAIRFDGTDDYMVTSGNVDLTAGYHIFFVYKKDTQKNFNGLFRIDNTITTGSSDIEIYDNVNGHLLVGGNRGDNFDYRYHVTDASSNLVANVSEIKCADNTNAVKEDLEILDIYLTAGNLFAPNQAALFHIGIGYGGTGGYLDGDFHEILIFDRLLTDKESNEANRYLGSKWGVSLP